MLWFKTSLYFLFKFAFNNFKAGNHNGDDASSLSDVSGESVSSVMGRYVGYTQMISQRKYVLF